MCKISVGGVLVAVSWGMLAGGASAVRAQSSGHLSWGPDLVVNGSFEDGVSGWSVTLGAREETGGEEVRSLIAVDSDVSHEGLASLRLSGTSDTTLWLALKTDPLAVRANAQYVLVAWIRSDKVVQSPGQYLNSNAYVQFLGSDGAIVRMGRSPVRATPKVLGTSDWREVQRVVKVPAGAVAAEIGVALTCTGSVWFDQIEFHEVTNVVWNRKDTDRFTYYSEGGDEPPRAVIEANAKYLKSLEHLLEIKPGEKIAFYRYASADRLHTLTGRRGRGYYSGREIHALRWDDRGSYVGALMSSYGETTEFIGKGTAGYCVMALQGRNSHDDAKKMVADGVLPSVTDLCRSEVIRNIPGAMIRPVASSFVGYLIDQYGAEKLKRLFSFKTEELAETTLDQTAYQVYHRTLEQLETDWKGFLQAR